MIRIFSLLFSPAFFIRLLKCFIDMIFFFCKSARKRVIVFNMDSIGEFQFFSPVLKKLKTRLAPSFILVITHPGIPNKEKEKEIDITNGIFFLDCILLRFKIVRKKISLYLNTEFQGLSGVYSICLFHGQPSKGVTFHYYKIWQNFNAFFLYGDLHRLAYEEAIATFLSGEPLHLETFNIGYPKSDNLLNGKYDREEFLTNLGLDLSKKTIIYAPAFNEGASLRVYGTEIIETLCKLPFNILTKLPIDCLRSTADDYATGGVNWFDVLQVFQSKYSNFRLVKDLNIDPALAASDIMVTCISSVGLEFLALGRPVIFFNTPLYFSKYLAKILPNENVESWANRSTINGGKEWGVTINVPSELPVAIQEVLDHPELYPKNYKELQSYLLYNPGNATSKAVDKIFFLLERQLKNGDSENYCEDKENIGQTIK